MDIKTLIAVATGEIPHNYRNGLCPDELQPESRDQDCQACKILTDAEKDDRFIVEVAGSLIGGVLRQIEAHPCQGHARQQEAEEAQHLTLVFKLPLTNMQRAVLESAEWTAASWSHAIRDRDAALKEAGCDQGQSAEIKSCDARALKVATARAFEYSGVNISLRDCHSRLIKNHDPDPCSYRMRITDPGCTGCAERDEDQSTKGRD